MCRELVPPPFTSLVLPSTENPGSAIDHCKNIKGSKMKLLYSLWDFDDLQCRNHVHVCLKCSTTSVIKIHVPRIDLIFKLSIMPLILVWNLSLKSGWTSLLLLCSSVTCLFGYFCAISAASSAPVAPPPITNTLSLVFIYQLDFLFLFFFFLENI